MAAASLLAACGGTTSSGGNQTSSGGSSSGGGELQATLTGHISTSYETIYPSGGHVGQAASLDWSITWTGHAPTVKGSAPTNQKWKINKMSGTVSWHGSGPNGELTCSGALSEAPGLTEGDVNPLLSAQTSSDSTHIDFVGEVPTDKQVVSSDTNPSDAQCNTAIAVGFLTDGPAQGSVSSDIMDNWQTLIVPKSTVALSDPTHFDPPSFSFHWSGPQPPVAGATTTLTDDGNWAFS